MKKICFVFLQLIIVSVAFCQENLPTDYLTKEFHAGRREALRQLMPANSVAVIFAFPERVFSNDVDYTFHQNPDLYYFSGYNEPNAVLFIFKEPQTKNGKTYNELFFIQKKDPEQESWTGRRMGVEKVKQELGFDMVFEGSAFKNFPIDFSTFNNIIFENLPSGMIDDAKDSSDLYDLTEQFKSKANIPETYNESIEISVGRFIQYASISNLKYFTKSFRDLINAGKIKADYNIADNLSVQDILDIKDDATLQAAKEKAKSKRINTSLYNTALAKLREIKTPEELVLLKKSVEISSMAHAEVMKAIKPGMSEKNLQAIFEFVHKQYGAEEEGYPPIVGAGNNGCILHYEENTNMNFGNEMVLMDVASEYHGYSADVTRTVPSTGKFTPEQKAIYDLVYEAQEEVFKLCKEGSDFTQTETKARKVLSDGLLKLGIIKNAAEINTYYPHGCSHFLGLDVHDKGEYKTLKAGMTITVEPGIYIPQNSACDKKWWGIAVRIEDDVLIEKNSCTIMSAGAPRKSEDVEKMVAQKSVLNNYILPKLSN